MPCMSVGDITDITNLVRSWQLSKHPAKAGRNYLIMMRNLEFVIVLQTCSGVRNCFCCSGWSAMRNDRWKKKEEWRPKKKFPSPSNFGIVVSINITFTLSTLEIRTILLYLSTLKLYFWMEKLTKHLRFMQQNERRHCYYSYSNTDEKGNFAHRPLRFV